SDAAYYAIAYSESASSLARYDGVRFGHRASEFSDVIDMYKRSRSEGFGDEVKRRLLIGTAFLSGDMNEQIFRKAQKVRTLIKRDFQAAFEKFDLIIGTTTATPPFKLGEAIEDPLQLQTSDMLAVPANLAGLPALSLPCGFTESGLPIGLQIIGNHFDEQKIYNAAYAYEQATNHHKKRPVIGGAEV
ncbi:MAG: Asp-tRNA(Asn)/Glu-tRNA(Gln) amidotransferase subunit GatA, partial [Bacillales bacterium]